MRAAWLNTWDKLPTGFVTKAPRHEGCMAEYLRQAYSYNYSYSYSYNYSYRYSYSYSCSYGYSYSYSSYSYSYSYSTTARAAWLNTWDKLPPLSLDLLENSPRHESCMAEYLKQASPFWLETLSGTGVLNTWLKTPSWTEIGNTWLETLSGITGFVRKGSTARAAWLNTWDKVLP